MDSRRSRRVAAVIQYFGTEFSGFQIQNSERTVQGELEKALKVLFSQNTPVVGSGRTDSGVHAFYQVIHFDAPVGINNEIIIKGLNGILDYDVAVRELYEVESGFHSRFDAVAREYTYLIHNSKYRSPFYRDRAHWEQSNIDLQYLRCIFSYLIGTHDFSSFCKKKSSNECNNIRSITNIDATREDELIKIVISGNAFLHNMIRIIIGTCIKMHRKSDNPDTMYKILQSRNREAAGPTADSCGLYLSGVEYSPELKDRKPVIQES